MANYLLQTLIPLFSITNLLMAATSFKLDLEAGQTLAAGEYIFQGDARMVESKVRLTRGEEWNPGVNSVGRVVWSDPIEFWSTGQQLRFETTLKFRISPSDSRPAEGIAFFIAEVGTDIPQGSSGANLGVFGFDFLNANTFAIEFDSNINPGIDGAAMAHVGIDMGTPVSSNVTLMGSAMIAQDVSATIRYEPAPRLITVTVTTGNQVFTVTTVRDLSTLLTPQAQIGISASTGAYVAVHDLLFWEFRPIEYVPTSATQVV